MKIGSLPNYLSLRNQLIIIVVTCIVFYANTLGNQYALDDVMVCSENKYVKKGFSGIYNLLTKDSFYGYYQQATKLTGGRWRPLPQIVYAVEYQFTGLNAVVFHFTNLLFYILCCLLFFNLLRKYVLKDNPVAAFFAVVLFAINPVHTEVVANIKSLDELLSMVLLFTTLYYSLKYVNEGRNINHLTMALASYFLALLAKENGIVFFAILPVSFYYFANNNIKNAIINTIPYIVVGIVYLFIRFKVVGNVEASTELLNDPFLYANAEEKIATKIYVLGRSFVLLFFPYPLSYDYSYNQIPYVTFTNSYVIASVVCYLALAAVMLWGLLKRNIFAYGILFFLASIFLVSNLVVNVGGMIGERNLFQCSVGFVICVAVLLSYITSKAWAMNGVIAALVVVTLLFGYEVIGRNKDWYSNETLFIHDVEVVPNSVKANYFAGIGYINSAEKVTNEAEKAQLLRKSFFYFNRAKLIDSTIPQIYLNEGVAYAKLGELDNAEKSWNIVRRISPQSIDLQKNIGFLINDYSRKAMESSMQKDYVKSIYYAQKALQYDSLNAPLWYNLGGQYFNLQDYKNARMAWEKAVKIDPNFSDAKQALGGLPSVENGIKK